MFGGVTLSRPRENNLWASAFPICVSIPSSFRCEQLLRPRLTSARTGPCCTRGLLAGWSRSLCCLAPGPRSRTQNPDGVRRHVWREREWEEKGDVCIKVTFVIQVSSVRVCLRLCVLVCACLLWRGILFQRQGTIATFRQVSPLTVVLCFSPACVRGCVRACVWLCVDMHMLRCKDAELLMPWALAWKSREGADEEREGGLGTTQGQADSLSSSCLYALLISSAGGSMLSVKAISTPAD